MSGREYTKFTAAERLSFKVVPETCPQVEKALDLLHLPPREDLIRSELAAYGVEYSRSLHHAIAAIYAKTSNQSAHQVRKQVLYHGTYPLRLALVRALAELHGLDDASIYEWWISSMGGTLPQVLDATKAAA